MGDQPVETRFAVHEAICAQRYEAIERRLEDGSKRMTRIEHLLYITIAAVFLGPGVAAVFAKQLLGL
jgi:cell division protein FtsL